MNMEWTGNEGSVTGRDRDYSFAGFRLDVAARRLTQRDGSLVKLNSRAFETLVLLVAQPGEVLAKRWLLRKVWPDVVVGENNLNQAIVAIRRALGDNAEPRRFVQTISGRGYCFVAEVQASAVMPLRVAEPSPCERVFTVADYF